MSPPRESFFRDLQSSAWSIRSSPRQERKTTSINFALITLGTSGDVYPFIGLGKELRSRGHGVTLLANENFEKVAKANGLTFRSLISRKQTDALLDDPNNWHPIKSAQHGARWMAGVIDQTYEISAEAITDPETVILNSDLTKTGEFG